VAADLLSKAGHDLQWERCDNTSVIKSGGAGGYSSIGLRFVDGTPIWLKDVLARDAVSPIRTIEGRLMRLNDDGLTFWGISKYIEEI
jgi:hypothetical protein